VALLRLVVWNCSGRLHDKVADLHQLRPDVAVLPECACPEVLLRRVAPRTLGARDLLWDGTHPSRGLLVATFGAWRGAVDAVHRPRATTTLPVRLAGPAELRLLAVWARPPKPDLGHRTVPEPIGAALARLQPFLDASPSVVAGDFNRALAGRTRLGATLARRGFRSAYHQVRGVAPGEEPEATFFRLRRFPSPHHLDQVLVDAVTAPLLRAVEVHGGSRWRAWSDHAPLVVEMDVGD
jgi:hypothetical protein